MRDGTISRNTARFDEIFREGLTRDGTISRNTRRFDEMFREGLIRYFEDD